MRRKSNTCLAVLRDKDKTLWFAGDRRITWDYSMSQRSPRAKITKRDGILYAGAGHGAICELVVDQFNAPDIKDDQEVYEYIHEDYLPSLLSWLREENWVAEHQRKLQHDKHDIVSPEDLPSANIVIGIRDELYELIVDTHLISIDGIDAPYATGCGGSVALGALLATEKSGMEPRKRLKQALDIAAKVSPGCGDGIDILNNKVKVKK